MEFSPFYSSFVSNLEHFPKTSSKPSFSVCIYQPPSTSPTPLIHSTEWLWRLINFFTYLLTYLRTDMSVDCRRHRQQWFGAEDTLDRYGYTRYTMHTKNNIQSDTADFATGAATWRTGRNIRVAFDSGPLAPLHAKWCHSQNRKYITY